jgi:hypothetical protein
MVESKEEALVKEERRLEAIPTAVPPSNLPPAMDIGLFGLAFLYFPSPLLRERLGGSLYSVFSVKPIYLRSKRMASDTRGANEGSAVHLVGLAICSSLVP